MITSVNEELDLPAAGFELIAHDPVGGDTIFAPEMTGTYSIGVQFAWKGRMCRVGVRIAEGATREVILAAWHLLAEACRNPEAPESKAAFGMDRLAGNEIDGTFLPKNRGAATPRRFRKRPVADGLKL